MDLFAKCEKHSLADQLRENDLDGVYRDLYETQFRLVLDAEQDKDEE